jgi:rhodanese-related sulfurtransferase
MTDLTPEETSRRIQEGDLVLIDVREDYEWEAGHPAGAIHIPLSRLASDGSGVPRDRGVAFICLAGMRSAQAADAYAAKGYETYNVTGGFHAWFEAELPTEPENARVMPH